MDGGRQLAPATGGSTLVVLIGNLINDGRLSDFRSHIAAPLQAVEGRFEPITKLFRERLPRVEEVIDARPARIEGELMID